MTAVTLRAPEVRTYEPRRAALQLRDVEATGPTDAPRYLEGRAVPYGTWENVGWYLEQHEPGSLAKSIKEAANDLPLLLFHNNQAFPVGKAEEWREESDGLHGVWKMDGAADAAEAVRQAEDGRLTGLSIGFVPIRSSWEMAAEWNPDLGPEYQDKVVRQESRLLEVSLTPTPAYAGAQVTLVRSRDHTRREQANRRELAAWREYRESIRRGGAA